MCGYVAGPLVECRRRAVAAVCKPWSGWAAARPGSGEPREQRRSPDRLPASLACCRSRHQALLARAAALSPPTMLRWRLSRLSAVCTEAPGMWAGTDCSCGRASGCYAFGYAGGCGSSSPTRCARRSPTRRQKERPAARVGLGPLLRRTAAAGGCEIGVEASSCRSPGAHVACRAGGGRPAPAGAELELALFSSMPRRCRRLPSLDADPSWSATSARRPISG